MVKIFFIVGNTSDVIYYYYSYLEQQLCTDLVIHMMCQTDLISEDELSLMTFAAPIDIKVNSLVLQHMKLMSKKDLLKFFRRLQEYANQKDIGEFLQKSEISTCNRMANRLWYLR